MLSSIVNPFTYICSLHLYVTISSILYYVMYRALGNIRVIIWILLRDQNKQRL